MSGISRRRSSKWDKEDISPEIHHDAGRSTKAGSSYHEHESREYMAGRRGFQRDERMNEESMPGWEEDGNYARRMSPGLDGWRQESRSRSPRRTRGRSYRSRSRSRSRSPVYNPRREPELDHSNNSKMRHSVPLCRDFASGRCRKGDLCRFAHHGSPSHDTRRHFGGRTEDGWEGRRRDDGALRRHSEAYSTGGRSKPICNDFMKGRCTRGSSCKFRHHGSGSDEFGKGTMDGAYRDRDDDWRGKSGSSYDREPPVGSEPPMCRFFASGNCRNGNQCKFSHQSGKNAYPDGRHPQHSLDDTNKVWNDSNWGDKASLRGVSDSRAWDVDRNDYMDPGKLRSGEWSKDELANHKVGDSAYLRAAPIGGTEKMSCVETQSDQWKTNEISISGTKGIEKGFGDGKTQSPTGIFNPQMGPAGERFDSQPYPFISRSTGEQDTSQRALADNHYVSGMTNPNLPGDYLQSNPSFQVDNGTGTRNNGSSYVNTNVPASTPYGQGINQVDGGISAPPITRAENVGQTHPTFPSLPPIGENMQMAQLQAPVDTNLAMGQSQSTFPARSQGQGLPIPHHQVADDPKPADVAYTSNAGVAGLPASGAALGQNNALTEQLAQYTHLSATLAQLLEKRQQLPQLYAAIAQQSTVGGGSNLPDAAASVAPVSVAVSQPHLSSEQSTQYNPLSDSIETKVISSSKELLPTTGDPIAGSSKDVLQHQSHDPNVQGQAVASKEENGQATGAGANGTRDNFDQGAEDAGLDSGADDGKKGKDAKVIRSFKFALAEFIKELLKPKWKEGKMSKDVHKTIVKKVVDKVTDTIQVAHVPRTKEKIDQYMSSSKPKLDKLVQAYVEKYQKA